jgi:hypothetical protein
MCGRDLVRERTVVFVDPPHPIHELSLEVVSVLAN